MLVNVYFLQLVSLKRNPFTWDRQSIGKMLTPTITNVKLLSDQKEINVKNMPPGDELRVEIPTPKTSLVSTNYQDIHQRYFSYFSFIFFLTLLKVNFDMYISFYLEVSCN